MATGPRTGTVRQCAVLAGGLATRLGAITATTPKPILPVGGRPFLAWLLRELVRFGVRDVLLLTGHLSDAVEAAVTGIAASLPQPVNVRFSTEPVRAGTGGALFHARDQLDDRFLLLNGDSMIDFNLARMLAAAAADGPEVVGRIALRRLADTSRYGVVETEGDRVTAFRERPDPGMPGTINGGIYLFDRRVLDLTTEVCSLERDVMPKLAAQGALCGTVAEGWFIDIGVPDDLARAQTELPARLLRPALFLDRDGVLNVDHGWVGTRERFEWVPGALDAVRMASDRGWHVFIVTNQSGVARGHYDEQAVRALLDWIADCARAAGGTIDDARYCPYHPEAPLPDYRRDSGHRKPGPGMLLDLIGTWELDPAACLMIGDQPSDMQAAESAGVPGRLFPGGDLAAFLAGVLPDARTVPHAAA
jgi:D,D-heptose 1,7-bisphosphate phosphatase